MLFKADRQSRNNTSAKCLSEFGYSAQSPGNCLLILKENKNKKAEEATERAKLNEIKQEKRRKCYYQRTDNNKRIFANGK